MFIISLIFLIKEYDKMNNYVKIGGVKSISKNAYVGGDAYNYIICFA